MHLCQTAVENAHTYCCRTDEAILPCFALADDWWEFEQDSTLQLCQEKLSACVAMPA